MVEKAGNETARQVRDAARPHGILSYRMPVRPAGLDNPEFTPPLIQGKAKAAKAIAIVVDWGYHGNTSGLIDVSPYKFNRKSGRGQPDEVEVATLPDPYRGPFKGYGADAGRGGQVFFPLLTCKPPPPICARPVVSSSSTKCKPASAASPI